MQDEKRYHEPFSLPLGQRRGVSDLAPFALDLTWAKKRAEPGTAARSRAYPSPPMSGSPSLPPNATHEAGDRSQLHGSYLNASSQDAYRPSSTLGPHSGIQGPSPLIPPPQVRSYQSEPPDRMTLSSYHRSEEPAPTSAPYPSMSAQHVHHRPAPYMTMPGPLPPPPQPPSTQTYAGPTSQAPEDTQPFASPKSQRKTKGHVASACVPCKKAHLRC
ncbi:hypothetical protein BN1708_004522, partial [Verticillium longisporum]